MRTSPSLAVLKDAASSRVGFLCALLAALPLNFAEGTILVAEILIPSAAVVTIVRRGGQMRLGWPALLIILSMTYFFILAGGFNSHSSLFLRAFGMLGAALIVIDNSPDISAWTRLVPVTAVGIVGMLAYEVATGEVLIRGAARGAVDADTLRIIGPMTPGPTAQFLLIGFFLAMRSRALLLAAVFGASVFVTGSRTHVIAFALLALLSVISMRSRRIMALFTVGLVLAITSFVLSSALRERLLSLDDSSLGGRSDLWDLAWQQTLSSWPSGQPWGLTGGPFQAHHQLLSLALLSGALGLGVAVALLVEFARRSYNSRTLILAFSLLPTLLVGEYLLPVTPQASTAAAAAWLVVSTGSHTTSGREFRSDRKTRDSRNASLP